jgi:formylglycine-generating enzyme required for sulfatase activity
MNNGKVRIYELSKELNLDNRDILAVCDQLNISVKSHSSVITEAEADRIRSAAEKYTPRRVSSKSASSQTSSPVKKQQTPPPVKKQQILEVRRHRPLAEPPKRPAPETKQPVSRSGAVQPAHLSCRRTLRTRQGYIEPLDVGSAIPLHMVLIPGGTFLMGSPPDEIDRRETESPQHEVTISQFFMGRYPITQGQWSVVAKMPRIERNLKPEPANFKGDNHPVERVSWYDAVEFCARLEKHTNRPYRLPTEAEWEYACRAGTTTPFYFGKTLTDELANYNASSTYANGPEGKSHRRTTPVDYFGIANAFGLSDMHGNVSEWCQDHWHDNYVNAPTDGSAWLTGRENAGRVLRGGSWHYDPRYCRSADRNEVGPVNRDDAFGFRVVCSAPRILHSLSLPSPSLLTGLRVLLVEDETDTLELMAFMLEQKHAIVTAVSSAQEALEAFEQTKFDLLVSDIGMPEVDGYGLMRQIRSRPPEQGGHVPAIALTAYAGEYSRQQALGAGFQRHVPKPVELTELVRVIIDLVSTR